MMAIRTLCFVGLLLMGLGCKPCPKCPVDPGPRPAPAAELIVIHTANGDAIVKVTDELVLNNNKWKYAGGIVCMCPKCFWMCTPPPPGSVEAAIGMSAADAKTQFGVTNVRYMDLTRAGGSGSGSP
jgi:hypothetical protein